MIERLIKAFTHERRAATLAVIILVQSLCALFFLSDVVIDFLEKRVASSIWFTLLPKLPRPSPLRPVSHI